MHEREQPVEEEILAEGQAGEADVSELVAGLEAQGELVEDAAGRFRLDVARAREQLREHQLAQPELYACLIVEVAVLVGAKLIKFSSEGARLRAQFWGAGFTRDELEHLADALFVDLGGEDIAEGERRRRRARRLLALTVAGALGAGARSVELRSASAEGRLLVTSEGRGESWSFAALEGDAQSGGTEVLVDFPAGGGSPGRDMLRTRCRWSSFPIYLDDQRLSLGPEAAFSTEDGACAATDPVVVQDSSEPLSNALGLATIMSSTHDGLAWIELLTNGWLVERVPVPGGVSGLLAVVELDLRRDLAQAKVIRDEHFEGLLEAVRRSEGLLRERAPPAVLVEAPGSAPGLLDNVGGGALNSALLAGALVILGLLSSSAPWLAGVLFVVVIAVIIRRGWNHRVARSRHMLDP